MFDAVRVYLLGEARVIAEAPAIFCMAAAAIGVLIWAAVSWAYRSVISHKNAEISSQAAEIKLLDRLAADSSRQVDDLQKRPRSGIPQELAKTASLQLMVYGDERSPLRLAFDNIWRWYYLRMAVIQVEMTTAKEYKHELATLFITFDQPVEVGTLEITSPDISLPAHEVKEFTNRYAIIVFSDPLPSGTLEIRTH
jgi:hypothetical protein